jgi:hypothetical protein
MIHYTMHTLYPRSVSILSEALKYIIEEFITLQIPHYEVNVRYHKLRTMP